MAMSQQGGRTMRFFLIDKITDWHVGTNATAIKNVALSEDFFDDHFPRRPVMPGVLIIEALAQVGGLLAFGSGVSPGQSVYFMSIEKAKFRKPVVPGDQLRLEVNVLKLRGSVWKFSGNALVNDKVAAEAEFTAMVTDREI